MAQTIFGWKSKEVIGRSFVDHIICEKSYDDYLKLIIKMRSERPAEHTNQAIEVLAYKSDHTEIDIALGVSSANHARAAFLYLWLQVISQKEDQLPRSWINKKNFMRTY